MPFTSFHKISIAPVLLFLYDKLHPTQNSLLQNYGHKNTDPTLWSFSQNWPLICYIRHFHTQTISTVFYVQITQKYNIQFLILSGNLELQILGLEFSKQLSCWYVSYAYDTMVLYMLIGEGTILDCSFVWCMKINLSQNTVITYA